MVPPKHRRGIDSNTHAENSDQLRFKRTWADDLSFHGQKLVTGRHRIHRYPGMMHPAVADELLARFANSTDVIFDPFCGSGTALLTPSMRGHSSVGYDINPLALLIAHAKTDSYRPDLLQREIAQFRTLVLQSPEYDIPEIKNIDYWYAQSVLHELARIRQVLLSNTFRYSSFLATCFAYTCRFCSLSRRGEFKRIREKFRFNREPDSAIGSLFQLVDTIVPEFLNHILNITPLKFNFTTQNTNLTVSRL